MILFLTIFKLAPYSSSIILYGCGFIPSRSLMDLLLGCPVFLVSGDPFASGRISLGEFILDLSTG